MFSGMRKSKHFCVRFPDVQILDSSYIKRPSLALTSENRTLEPQNWLELRLGQLFERPKSEQNCFGFWTNSKSETIL